MQPRDQMFCEQGPQEAKCLFCGRQFETAKGRVSHLQRCPKREYERRLELAGTVFSYWICPNRPTDRAIKECRDTLIEMGAAPLDQKLIFTGCLMFAKARGLIRRTAVPDRGALATSQVPAPAPTTSQAPRPGAALDRVIEQVRAATPTPAPAPAPAGTFLGLDAVEAAVEATLEKKKAAAAPVAAPAQDAAPVTAAELAWAEELERRGKITPIVRGVRDGTLSPSVFRRYLKRMGCPMPPG